MRSADQKSSCYEPPTNVDGPKDPRRQRTDRMAGNQQRASPPQSRTCKDYRDIAQMQQIGPAPKSNVGRQPPHGPEQADPPQDGERVCASGHASSPLDASIAAQPTTGGCSCMQRVISHPSRRGGDRTIAAGNTLELAAGGTTGESRDWARRKKMAVQS